jgi:hypothetical protein
MKAEGRRQKAEGKSADALRAQNFAFLRFPTFALCLLPSAFRVAACLLPFAFPEGAA